MRYSDEPTTDAPDPTKELAPEPPDEPKWIVDLRASHDRLLNAAGAAEDILQAFDNHIIVQRCLAVLRAAIAAAEELAP